MRTIAYFITPHGFGHGARACAVMNALQEIAPQIQFDIYTQVPLWFFQDSLSTHFNYHPLLTDIGLVQASPLHEDLKQTLERLDNFLPFDPLLMAKLAQQINKNQCELIICDIAPLGIAVAKETGIPAVLVENFTWDWIYEGYLDQVPEIQKHIDFTKGLFEGVDYHIQTQPLCHPIPADLTTQPVSRKARLAKEAVRSKLGLPQDASVILISMGGIPPQHYPFLAQMATWQEMFFVIPGASESLQRHENLVLLPHHSEFFHPDLIQAADLVVGKLGYSTLAEAYWAGIPFGYVTRTRFRESEILGQFVEQEMGGFAMSETQFETGDWISLLPPYLELAPRKHTGPNGADQIARFILSLPS
ncbi:conserved hypothetical protein [Nitrosococcus halophilus Nc 4]|uniref:Glycosyl transferase family 28 C-terminal domain-containing protein n=1 Tax=Nitrosococcus halophilus (strain Nc4) TaxID=472759 RepID=D5BZA5_NITHN|nr:hypothetical protein [Nitrosococcus halophilus]ADE16119.1 conserved hypothetical protein [Nitrosococcus halophilus Nc 4]